MTDVTWGNRLSILAAGTDALSILPVRLAYEFCAAGAAHRWYIYLDAAQTDEAFAHTGHGHPN